MSLLSTKKSEQNPPKSVSLYPSINTKNQLRFLSFSFFFFFNSNFWILDHRKNFHLFHFHGAFKKPRRVKQLFLAFPSLKYSVGALCPYPLSLLFPLSSHSQFHRFCSSFSHPIKMFQILFQKSPWLIEPHTSFP